jgi:hypothetical protein
MPPLEPAIVQAHAETRNARDVLRSKGLEFPLLVPTSAEGLDFSGVAPQVDDPQVVRVEMAFGGIDIGNPNARNALLSLTQIKTDRPVSFAPVRNLQVKKSVPTQGTIATLEIGGPYDYHPQGAMYLFWERIGVNYFIKAVALSEEQPLKFADSLVPLS